jgi:transcriptional regulator with XRE-family HTH domain
MQPPHPIDVYVGRKIRNFREAIKMSQEDLGKTLDRGNGLAFQQVQKYEKGTNRVSCSRLSEIAETLGVNIQDFFPPKKDDKRNPGPLELATTTPGAPALLLAYVGINTPGRELTREIAELIRRSMPAQMT